MMQNLKVQTQSQCTEEKAAEDYGLETRFQNSFLTAKHALEQLQTLHLLHSQTMHTLWITHASVFQGGFLQL